MRKLYAALALVLAVIFGVAGAASAHNATVLCTSVSNDFAGNATVTYYGPNSVVLGTFSAPLGTTAHNAPVGAIGYRVTWPDGFSTPNGPGFNTFSSACTTPTTTTTLAPTTTTTVAPTTAPTTAAPTTTTSTTVADTTSTTVDDTPDSTEVTPTTAAGSSNSEATLPRTGAATAATTVVLGLPGWVWMVLLILVGAWLVYMGRRKPVMR